MTHEEMLPPGIDSIPALLDEVVRFHEPIRDDFFTEAWKRVLASVGVCYWFFG